MARSIMSEKPVIVILAGSRPGGDALTDGQPFSSKALYPIAGRAMLARVLDVVTLFAVQSPVIVVAQDCNELLNNADLSAYAGKVRWQKSRDTIAETMRELLQNAQQPMLVTTADNVLLSEETLSEFLHHATGSDLAVGAVSKTIVMNSALQTKRTWLKLRNESWSGCNLFYFGGHNIMPLLDAWAAIEQSRKKARSFFSAFGPYILLRYLFGWLTETDFSELLSKRYKIIAKIVPLSDAKACIDADKIEDVALIESILCKQQR